MVVHFNTSDVRNSHSVKDLPLNLLLLPVKSLNELSFHRKTRISLSPFLLPAKQNLPHVFTKASIHVSVSLCFSDALILKCFVNVTTSSFASILIYVSHTHILCLFRGKACPPGRYGTDCAQMALCGEGARSDPVTGRCVCKAGQRGEDCGQGQESV